MAKIALISIRYGEEINGGAEYHCRMLAERLAPTHEVHVLTTTLVDIYDRSKDFPSGISLLNQVHIHRFPAITIDAAKQKASSKASKLARKIRRAFYRTGLTSVFKTFPIWNYKVAQEIELLKNHSYYSEGLINYIQEQQADYDAFIFFTYENPLTVLGALSVPEKSILVPTAHMEGMLFRSINSQLFSQVKHIAFNTETEYEMCKPLFQRAMAPHSIVGVGVEIAAPEDWSTVLAQYPIEEPYLLYSGRITAVKTNQLFDYFIQFKEETGSPLQLVLTGDVQMPKVVHPDIHYLGYVSEAVKIALMQHSFAIVNSSKAESLSLLALEAMCLGQPVLANRQAEVMLEHERKSKGAVQCYGDYTSFKQLILSLQQHPEKRALIAEHGKAYVQEYYNWERIISKFETIIKSDYIGQYN